MERNIRKNVGESKSREEVPSLAMGQKHCMGLRSRKSVDLGPVFEFEVVLS